MNEQVPPYTRLCYCLLSYLAYSKKEKRRMDSTIDDTLWLILKENVSSPLGNYKFCTEQLLSQKYRDKFLILKLNEIINILTIAALKPILLKVLFSNVSLNWMT